MVMAPLKFSLRVFHSRLPVNESELVPNIRDFAAGSLHRSFYVNCMKNSAMYAGFKLFQCLVNLGHKQL